MARPTTRKGTANIQYQKRIPADIKRLLETLPPSYRPIGWGKTFITLSTGTADKRKAAAEHARLSAVVEERFERLRAGVRSLTQKETVALAGTVYKQWAEGLEDNPGTVALWDTVLLDNVKARVGKFGRASLMIGDTAKRASMEERFGPMVDLVLARECLIIDQASRLRLLDEISTALDQAALKLKQNASGDYQPDEIGKRFPAW